MNDALISYLRAHRAIPDEDQVLISEAFQLRTYKQGEWLLKAGRVARQLFFINSGVLKITVPHPASDDLVYYFVQENQLIGLLYSMYGNAPSAQGLQAATNVEVSYINDDKLLMLYEQLPYLRGLIDEIKMLTTAHMVTVRNNYLIGEALDKYKLFLQNEPAIAARVTQKDIASYLGITPQSFSRIRRMLMNTARI